MGPLVWDQIGEKKYETGVEKGVLYLQDAVSGLYTKGVAWNGLSNVTESPSGAEPTAVFADNAKYLSLMSAEEYAATIEAYMYPDEFAECNGEAEVVTGVYAGQQARKPFGFAYKTLIGNDVSDTAYGYKIHLVYGCKASPSEQNHSTVNDSPEATAMSWEINTTPVPLAGHKPTATLVIDSTKVDATKLAAFEKIIYGDAAKEPRLPLPDEVKTLLTPSAG